MGLLIGLIVVGVLLYLLFWPVAADPVAWTPPQAPALEGKYAVNRRLTAMARLPGEGPEDIAFDDRGRLYSGLEDGRIVRMQADGAEVEIFAHTNGRPLGLKFDGKGNLLVADADKGLLAVAADGTVRVLVDAYDGKPLRLTNHLDVAADGTVYFSESSTKFTLAQYQVDILENRPNGRLLAYDPAAGTTRLVLDDLYFANGMAISPDQSFLLVAETSRYRIRRIWLRGPRAGEAEIFVENLPGFPDNLSRSDDGRFWVALASPRKADVDLLFRLPFARRVMLRLPQQLLPSPTAYAFVLAFDGNGRVVENLQDPSGSYAMTTAAVVQDGVLYVGSRMEDGIGRVELG